jgi:hypothetical protein
MYNINSGYVGASRNVRSQEAINSFEVPILMINKSLIDLMIFLYFSSVNKRIREEK